MHTPRYYTLDLFRLVGIFSLLFGVLLVGGAAPVNSGVLPGWIAKIAGYTNLGVELLVLSHGFSLAIRSERQTSTEFFARPSAQGIAVLVAYSVLSAFTNLLKDSLPVAPSMPLARLLASPISAQLTSSPLVLAYSWAAALGLSALIRIPHVSRYLSKYMTGALLLSLTVLSNSHPESNSPLAMLRMLTLADYLPYLVAGYSFHKLMRNRALVWDMYNLCFAYMLAIKSVTLHCAEHLTSSTGALPPVTAQVLVTMFFVAFFLFSTGKLYRLNPPTAKTWVRHLNLVFVSASLIGIPCVQALSAHVTITVAAVIAVFVVVTSTFLLFRLFEFPLLVRANSIGKSMT